MNSFPENVKNGFELILWLKKGGGRGLIHEGVLYAGFYGMFERCGHRCLGPAQLGSAVGPCTTTQHAVRVLPRETMMMMLRGGAERKIKRVSRDQGER